MNIKHFAIREAAAAAAGEALNKLLAENRKRPILLLLSGGSALSILNYIEPSSLSENLTITMLDERFSSAPQVNNFLQLQKCNFYRLAQEANANFLNTLPRLKESIEDMRARLENSFKKWQKTNPRGKILATMGMGADGHIAGIFPYPDNLKFFKSTFENSHLYAAYSAVGKHQHEDRITATLTLFRNIDESIVFICGAEKKDKFHELISGQSQSHVLPAAGIFKTKHYQIFTDISELP